MLIHTQVHNFFSFFLVGHAIFCWCPIPCTKLSLSKLSFKFFSKFFIFVLQEARVQSFFFFFFFSIGVLHLCTLPSFHAWISCLFFSKVFYFCVFWKFTLEFFSPYCKLALCIFALYQVSKLKALIHFSLAFNVCTHLEAFVIKVFLHSHYIHISCFN